MEKQKNKSNKIKRYMLIFIIVIIILSLSYIISKNFISKNNKKYDVNIVEKRFLDYYSDLNFESFQSNDVALYFTISPPITSETVMIGNFNPNEEIKDELIDPNIILLISNITKDECNEYYDALSAFILSYKDGVNIDEKLSNLYKNAILKKGDNYIYLIIGTYSNTIEKELNELYN